MAVRMVGFLDSESEHEVDVNYNDCTLEDSMDSVSVMNIATFLDTDSDDCNAVKY